MPKRKNKPIVLKITKENLENYLKEEWTCNSPFCSHEYRCLCAERFEVRKEFLIKIASKFGILLDF